MKKQQEQHQKTQEEIVHNIRELKAYVSDLNQHYGYIYINEILLWINSMFK